MKKENTILLDDEEVMLLDDEDDAFVTDEIKAPSFSLKKNSSSDDVSPKKQSAPIEKPKGMEVIFVVWPEEKHGKQYLYDPNGETVEEGDTVLVPSYDKERNIEIVREATVAEGNHLVDPASLRRKPKKVISVVARKKDEVTPEDPQENAEAAAPEETAPIEEAHGEEISDTENTKKGLMSHLKKWLGLA